MTHKVKTVIRGIGYQIPEVIYRKWYGNNQHMAYRYKSYAIRDI